MARIRSIHPGAPLDEDVASMSLAARLLWAYLPCHADREGRLRDSAFAIKAAIFPGDAIDVDALIAELADRRHVVRYEVDGRRYLQIRNFAAYQFPHHRETASVIPPAQGKPRANPGPDPDKARLSPPDPDPDPVLDPVPERGEENPGSAQGQPEAPWHARDWLRRFGIAWAARKGVLSYGGGASDAIAVRDLGECLDALAPQEREQAQRDAAAIFARYLDLPRAGDHPFKWFVERFNGLRLPESARPEVLPPHAAAGRSVWAKILAEEKQGGK